MAMPPTMSMDTDSINQRDQFTKRDEFTQQRSKEASQQGTKDQPFNTRLETEYSEQTSQDNSSPNIIFVDNTEINTIGNNTITKKAQ